MEKELSSFSKTRNMLGRASNASVANDANDRGSSAWWVVASLVLGCTRKLAEQARGSKSVSSVVPSSLLQLLPVAPALASFDDGP